MDNESDVELPDSLEKQGRGGLVKLILLSGSIHYRHIVKESRSCLQNAPLPHNRAKFINISKDTENTDLHVAITL